MIITNYLLGIVVKVFDTAVHTLSVCFKEIILSFAAASVENFIIVQKSPQKRVKFNQFISLPI